MPPISSQDALLNYLSGDPRDEREAISALRRIGEAAARRVGMQPCEVDEVGVDFAGFILTEGAEPLRAYDGRQDVYLWRSARWFATHYRRQLCNAHVVLTERVEDVESVAVPDRPEEDLVSGVLHQDLLERVERSLAGLPGRDRLLFRLCMLEGMACTDAAAQLNCKPAAVRKRLERIRRYLRSVVRDY